MNPIRTVTPLSTVCAVLVFSGLLGLLYESRVLLAIFQALLAYLLLSNLYVRWVGARLDARRVHMPRAYDEEEVPVRLIVRNRSGLPLPFLRLRDWFAPDVIALKKISMDRVGRRGMSATYTGACARGRGAFLIGPLTATVADPLGLFHRTVILADRTTLLVLPKTFPIRDLALTPFPSMLPAVSTDAPRPGHSTNFYGTREYRAGDNMRHIHWRASARWGRLVLKEFEIQRRCEISVVLDLDREALEGVGRRTTLEISIRVAASIAEFAAMRGHPYQLIADPGNPIYISAATGHPHLLRVLETLARLRARGERPYFDLVRSAFPYFAEGSTVILVAGRPGEEEELGSVLAEMRVRQFEPQVVLLDRSTFTQLRERGPDEGVAKAVQICDLLGVDCRVLRSDDDLEKVFASTGVAV